MASGSTKPQEVLDNLRSMYGFAHLNKPVEVEDNEDSLPQQPDSHYSGSYSHHTRGPGKTGDMRSTMLASGSFSKCFPGTQIEP